MKRCLVFLQAPEQAAAALGMAARLVSTLGVQGVDVVALRPEPKTGTLPITSETTFLYEEQQRSRIAALHAQFCLWLQTEYQEDQAQLEATAVTWEETEGGAQDILPDRARRADLIIAAMNPVSAQETDVQALNALVFYAACPVLLVPSGWDGPCGQSVLVAWAESAAARRVLDAASPFLEKAHRVSSLVAVGENLPSSLAHTSITHLPLPLSEQNTADVVTVEAQKRKADLVILAMDLSFTNQSVKTNPIAGLMAHGTTPILLYSPPANPTHTV
ncbi:MAG: hypothetical protein ACTINM_08650 [Acetobacter cibinongensis]